MPFIPLVLSCSLAAPAPPVVATAVVEEVTPSSQPVINLAICLDTSGSMKGLIDAARTKLWEIVNDLALAEPTPDLRVALLTYGNNGHESEAGFVHVQTDFTTDLDLVSERLFALSTNGGDEYVGRVVDRATTDLKWHPSSETLKLVIVAGNESADQDPKVSFRDACRNAIGREIMVNSIYCGNPEDDVAPGWREVAMLADGKFASIDHNEGTIVIATPFDDELARLSAGVNGTYVAWTADGKQAQAGQWMQDENAANLNSEACSARAVTKGGALYQCGWDLVSAAHEADFDWSTVEGDQLPEIMRPMTIEERQAHVEKLWSDRTAIQTTIQEIGQKRQAYIQGEMRRQQIDASKAFGFVIRKAVRDQASVYGYDFGDALVDPSAPFEGPTLEPVGSDRDGC